MFGNNTKPITWHRLLGVEPGATADQVSAAYRKLVMACHPDKHDDKETFTRLLVLINEAKEAVQNGHSGQVGPRGCGKCFACAMGMSQACENSPVWGAGQQGQQAYSRRRHRQQPPPPPPKTDYEQHTATCGCGGCVEKRAAERCKKCGKLRYMDCVCHKDTCQCDTCMPYVDYGSADAGPQDAKDYGNPADFELSEAEYRMLAIKEFWKFSGNGNQYFQFKDYSVVTIFKRKDEQGYTFVHNDEFYNGQYLKTWDQAHKAVLKRFKKFVKP